MSYFEDIYKKRLNRYGTTYQKIASDNNIPNPNLIYPNQKLIINKTKNDFPSKL